MYVYGSFALVKAVTGILAWLVCSYDYHPRMLEHDAIAVVSGKINHMWLVLHIPSLKSSQVVILLVRPYYPLVYTSTHMNGQEITDNDATNYIMASPFSPPSCHPHLLLPFS